MFKFGFFIAIAAFLLILIQTPSVFAQIMPDMSADTTPPNFISIATASSEETQANIVWTTDELTYGYVEYGETVSYGQSTPKSTMAKMDDSASITGLTPGTEYHYRVIAEDQSGNTAYSEDRILETAAEVIVMDNTPPQISQVSVSNITTSEATISWTTDEPAQGNVGYGLTEEYGSSTPLTDDYSTEHSVIVSNLEPSTNYHFHVTVQDESGNQSVSPDETFTTSDVALEPTPAPEPTATTTLFAISNVETASVSTSTATIIWTTSEPADAQVFYSPGESYTSSTPVYNSLNQSHQIILAGLQSGTNYFYKVVSKNASGQTLEKSGFEFNTLFQPVVINEAPTISNVSVESVGTSTAVITWQTDKPAQGEVRYGTTTAYKQTDGGHTNFLTDHRHTLSGLSSNTLYNFEIIVRDENGNETIYENVAFTTLAESAAAIPPSIEQADAVQEQALSLDYTEWEESGGSGGRRYLYDNTITKPAVIKTESLNKQILFVLKTVSKKDNKIVIARDFSVYPKRPDRGRTVYFGSGGTFTDAHLQNGKIYYYSIFKIDKLNHYSDPVKISVAPKQNNNQAHLNTVPTVVQKTPIFTFNKIMSLGDKNHDVKHLQILLASDPSLYPEGLITGYFGSLTEKAVKKFQEKYKIAATGAIDKETLKKLEVLSRAKTVKGKVALYESLLKRDLKRGMDGEDVVILQQFLENAGAYPEGLVTGYFGPLTLKALQTFQKQQNIDPPSGYLGSVTRHRILDIIRSRSASF